MTTIRETKRLVAPLLAKHSDLALAQRAIVVKPLRHVLRFVLVDRTGSANQFEPQWAVTATFHRLDFWPLGLGERILKPSRPHLWYWDEPDVAQTLLQQVETLALPKLRAIETLQDYVDLAALEGSDSTMLGRAVRFIYNIALGKLDEAQRIFADAPNAPAVLNLNRHDAFLGDRLLEQGDALSRKDRSSLAAMLHEWEAYTVKSLKLGHIWERTPFPLELN